MNNDRVSLFVDKQIMDLSNSKSNEFINLPSELKKDEILPTYDFLPILPPVNRSSNFGSGDGDALCQSSSFDSKPNVSSTGVLNYSSLDFGGSSNFNLGKNDKPINAPVDMSLVAEIDMALKKYTDKLMTAMDGVSSWISQLETRTHNLEISMDDLKVSLGNNHCMSDGKLRQMENILREVHSGVQFIREKQEIIEAQLQIDKLQVENVEQIGSQKTVTTELTQQPGATSLQQFSVTPTTQPPPTLPPPNAPPPPPPLQYLKPHVQFPNQCPQNQSPSIPQQESNFPPTNQTPENDSQHYLVPPPLQRQQHNSLPSLPQHQHLLHPQPQYSRLPSPLQPHLDSETQYSPPQTYIPGIRHQPHLSTGAFPLPSQQVYPPAANLYQSQSSRPSPGHSNLFGSSSASGESFPHSSSPSHYSSGSPMRTQHQSGGSGYPQLPTARILPQALPTAPGPGSGGPRNKAPIDDVVDRVSLMGFPRDHVRAIVQKLTENGESVDLNVVLDKLGDSQARGWFGR